MRPLQIYRNFMIAYIMVLFFSGFLMDLALVSPELARLPYNFYYNLGNLHRNVFLYGLILNLFPGYLFFTSEKINAMDRLNWNQSRFLLFWGIYQVGIILGFLYTILGRSQTLRFMEMEYFPDLLILVSFTFFTGYLLKSRFMKNITKSEKMKDFVWNQFILIPALVWLIYFLIMNLTSPAGFFSSINILKAYQLNILEHGFGLFLYNYFIINLVFGLLYLLYLPDEFDPKLHAGIQIQWYLQTILFLLSLYYDLNDFGSRESSFESQIVMPLVYFPLFIGAFYLKYLKQRTSGLDQKILLLIVMFIQIFALGKILASIPWFHHLLQFSDWPTAQNHILALGILLPFIYILIQSLSDQSFIFTFNKNKYLSGWLVMVIFFVAASWLSGVVQSALVNKMDTKGFLEFPGWIAIVGQLYPYRIFHLLLDFIFLFLILFLFWRWIKKFRPNIRKQVR